MMDASRVEELSMAAADFYYRHDDYGQRAGDRAHAAFHHLLTRYVPDDATAAVTKLEDIPPAILAADDRFLYIADATQVEDEQPARVRLRFVPLDPERVSMELNTSFPGSSSAGGSLREVAVWDIKTEGETFAVSVETEIGGENRRRGKLVRHLAASLGLQFGADG